MDPTILNTSGFLYRTPELYDVIYRFDPISIRLMKMCHDILGRNGKEAPDSVLDLGCGTAFKSAYLHDSGYECVGVDYLEPMIAYARREYPDIRFEVGDIRDVRVGREFDVITCLGWVLENVHSMADIERSMATFVAHAKEGTLLVLGLHNPIGDLAGLGARSTFTIDQENFTVTGEASFTVDRRRQILTRRLIWTLPAGATEEEVTSYRLFFPMELEHYLVSNGFGDITMYDNIEMDPSDLEGSMLYVTATYQR